MARYYLRYLLVILFMAMSSPSAAAFILDPNTGTYIAGGGMDAPSVRPPITEDEKKADSAKRAELREALSQYGKYFRYYRYLYAGAGAKRSSVDQGGTSGSDTGYVLTLGMDYDGLTWTTPWIIELRGNFGFSPTAGETAIMWYLGAPIWKGWFDKSKNIRNPMRDDVDAGMTLGKAILKNGDRIPEWADQYVPIKLEVGVGYQGISFEQTGGSVVDGGVSAPNRTTGMIAGLSFAGRIGYFGPSDMIRLTGYYLASSHAETGGEFPDTLTGLGGTMNLDATVKGTLIEGKLDWYHRSDERIGAGNLLSGYGLSLIGRRIHLDEGRIDTFRGPTAGNVTTVFPEQDVTQVELLFTVGFLR